MIKTLKWKGLIAVVTVLSLIAAAVPTVGSVVITNNVTAHSGVTGPFATLNNSTSPLASSSVTVNSYGNEANVSITGIWKTSSIHNLYSVNGFVSQVLGKNINAYTYLTVSEFTGSSNISKLYVSINGSSGVNQKELAYSSGTMQNTKDPVLFSNQNPLNISISFNPGKTTKKLKAVYNAYLTINTVTYTENGNGAVYTHEEINIALTMWEFNY